MGNHKKRKGYRPSLSLDNKKRGYDYKKCPKCKQFSLFIRVVTRKNWPFGRKSKPRYSFKRKDSICKYCNFRYKS
jgi:hypothetical protein